MNWNGFFKDWDECQEIVMDWAKVGFISKVSQQEIETIIQEIEQSHIDLLEYHKTRHSGSRKDRINELMRRIRGRFLYETQRLLNSSIASQIPKTRDKLNYYKHNEEEE